MSLFSNDVSYWETPFKKLSSFAELRSEWQAIKSQTDIDITFSLFSTIDNTYSIQWDLTYTDRLSSQQHWAGVYLLKLNQVGKCTFFYQVGENQR